MTKRKKIVIIACAMLVSFCCYMGIIKFIDYNQRQRDPQEENFLLEYRLSFRSYMSNVLHCNKPTQSDFLKRLVECIKTHSSERGYSSIISAGTLNKQKASAQNPPVLSVQYFDLDKQLAYASFFVIRDNGQDWKVLDVEWEYLDEPYKMENGNLPFKK